jgi:hypothetical protein
MATWFHVNYNWNSFGSAWKNIRGIVRDLFWVGPRNVIRYAPVIWLDQDWDYSYLLRIMEWKLRKMSDCLENGHLLHGSRYARQTLIAATLCKRISGGEVYYKNAEVWPEKGKHQGRHVSSTQKQDQEMLGKLIGKYITHWWD